MAESTTVAYLAHRTTTVPVRRRLFLRGRSRTQRGEVETSGDRSELIEADGAVSEEVVREMVQDAGKVCAYLLVITVRGPGGLTTGKAVLVLSRPRRPPSTLRRR